MRLVCDHALVQSKQPITHVRLWAVHTDMVMHEWARCTSHLRRKMGRRLDDLGGVCISIGYTCCCHANMYSCSTSRRSLMDEAGHHTSGNSSPPRICTQTYTTYPMTAIWRMRLAMQRSHPCTNGRCGYRTYWKSSIYGKSTGISSMYGNSMPLVCTCSHTNHLLSCLRDRFRNHGTENVGVS